MAVTYDHDEESRKSLDQIERKAREQIRRPTPLMSGNMVGRYDPDRKATVSWMENPRHFYCYLESFDARDILGLCQEVRSLRAFVNGGQP